MVRLLSLLQPLPIWQAWNQKYIIKRYCNSFSAQFAFKQTISSCESWTDLPSAHLATSPRGMEEITWQTLANSELVMNHVWTSVYHCLIVYLYMFNKLFAVCFISDIGESNVAKQRCWGPKFWDVLGPSWIPRRKQGLLERRGPARERSWGRAM